MPTSWIGRVENNCRTSVRFSRAMFVPANALECVSFRKWGSGVYFPGTSASKLRSALVWLGGLVFLLAASCSVQAQTTLTAEASSSTNVELMISGHMGRWWNKQTSPEVGNCSATSAVQGTPARRGGLKGNTNYIFKAYSEAGCDEESYVATSNKVLTQIGQPGVGAYATSGSNTLILLSNNVGGDGEVEKWQYKQKVDGDGQNWNDIEWQEFDSETNSTTLSHVITGLTNGIEYQFRVRAKNGWEPPAGQDGPPYFSLQSGASTARAPRAPTLTASSVEATTATLTINNWSSPWHYKHENSPRGFCSAVAGTGDVTQGTTTANPPLSGNTSYTFAAYSDSDCTTNLATASEFLTKPGKPETPTVVPVENSNPPELTLSSSLRDNGTGALTKWQYAYRTGGISSAWTDIEETSKTLSHNVPDLTDGKGYRFRVRAINATGTGLDSDTSLPPELEATSGQASTVNLTIRNWSKAWWHKRTSPSGGGCSNQAVPAGTNSFLVRRLSGNTNYTFRAYSDPWCTTELDEVEVVTRPDKPTKPGVAATEDYRKFILSSSVSGDGELTEWQYRLRIDQEVDGEEWEDIPNYTSTELSHIVTVPEPDELVSKNYQFRVRAVNKSGSSINSDYSDFVQSLESALTVSSVETTTATLTIVNHTDIVGNTKPWYYQQTAPDGKTCSAEIAAGTPTASLTKLSGNTNYSYSAYSEAGCPADKELAEVEFLTKPSRPVIPTVEAGSGSGTLTLSSSVSDDDTLTKWQYQLKEEGEGSFGEWEDIPVTSTTLREHIVPGLTDDTDYQFKVRAVNRTGESLDSYTSVAVAPLDETLVADTVDVLTKTLTIGNWPYNWWYKYTVPSGGTCSTVVSARERTADPIRILGNTNYTFRAYEDSLCTTELADVQFLTKPGKPTKPEVAPGINKLTLSSSVSGDGDITRWQYQQKEGEGSFGGEWEDITQSSTMLTRALTGLAPETEYQFKVRAVNSTGGSVESDVSAVATPLTVELTARNVTADSATLSIFGDPGAWWYERTDPSGGTCSAAVDSNMLTASLTELSGNTYYSYSAYSDGDCSTEIASVEFLTNPGKPGTLTVEAGDRGGTLTLSSSVSDAGTLTKWQYQQKEGEGRFGEWEDIPVTSTTLLHVVSGLKGGTGYQFKVRAVNAEGNGEESGQSMVAAPLVLMLEVDRIEATEATLTISNWPDEWWHKYTTPFGGVCSWPVAKGTSTYGLTGLSGNTNYSFVVYSDGGCSTEIASVKFLTKPGKPETPTVEPGSGNTRLTLSSSVSGDGDITKWQYKQKVGDTEEWEEIQWQNFAGDSDSTKLLHDVSGLISEMRYQFKVRAVNAEGNGLESLVSVAVEPSTARLVVRSPEATDAIIYISGHTDTNGDTKPWYYQQTVPPDVVCTEGDAAMSEVSLTGLSGNTLYSYTAYRDSQCANVLTAAVQFLTKPGKPETPTVEPGSGSGTLTLSSSVSGDGMLTGWRYGFDPSDERTWEPIAQTSTTLQYTVERLIDGTDYEIWVRAVNHTGAGVLSDLSAPAAPLDETLTADKIMSSTASLTIGNWPSAWHYKHTAPDGGSCSPASTTTANPPLSGNTNYTFRAYSEAGCPEVAELAEVQFLTKPGTPTTPGVAATENAGELRLSSSLPDEENGDGTLTMWQYQVKEEGGEFGGDDDWESVDQTSTTLSHVVSGLTGGTGHQFRVRAVNATGDGMESDASAAVAPLEGVLTAGSVEATTATLTIDKWTKEWWHKHTVPSGGTCQKETPEPSEEIGGTSDTSLTGLSGNTNYTFSAYSEASCPEAAEIATADQFLTKPGTPTTPEVAATEIAGELALSSSVSGDGTLTEWQYKQKLVGGTEEWEVIQWKEFDGDTASKSLSHTLKGLIPGTEHEFRVRAVNGTGDGLESDASDAVAPLKGVLTADPIGAKSATLTIDRWQAAWHYKYTAPDGGPCSAIVPENTKKADLTGLSGNTNYTFRAYSKDGCPEVAELAEVQFLTTPGTPAKPTVATTGNAVELKIFSSVTGDGDITGWQYKQKLVGGTEEWEDIQWKEFDGDTASKSLSHVVSGLNDDKEYQFRVRAVNGQDGSGLVSDASEAMAPSDKTLTASSVKATTATLTIGNWSKMWHYKHTVPSDGVCSAKVAANEPDASLTGLLGNTWYAYKAYEDDLCAKALAAADRFLTTPGTPATPTVAATGNAGELTLFSSVTGDGDITEWQYQVKEVDGEFGGDDDWNPIHQASTTLSHVVSGLTGGTGYQFRVRAVNGQDGIGLESGPSAAVVPLEGVLTADPIGAKTATLTIGNWSKKWHYKHTVPSGGTCQEETPESSEENSGTSDASLTGLLGNTNYTFRAYSEAGCPEDAEIAEVQFLTKPGKPKKPTVATTGNAGELRLFSSLPGDENGGGTLTRWQYQVKEVDGEFGGDDDWEPIDQASTTLSHNLKGLNDDKEYQFRVRAVNATGNGLESDASEVVAPSDITLTASLVEATTATLTIGRWQAAWHYKYTAPDDGSCSSANTSTANPTELSGNTNYTFRAYSKAGCPEVAELAEVQFLTKPGEPGKPMVKPGSGSGTLTLSATLGGDGAITKWQYKKKEGSGSFDADWTDIPNSASTTLSHVVSGLTGGTGHQFRVRAVNVSGNGLVSKESVAATPLAPTLTANSTGAMTATLTVGNWSGYWWHKFTSPSGGTCSAAVAANTLTASPDDLSGNTNYTFSAYSDQFCSSEIATADQFLTRPGMPTIPTAVPGAGTDKLTLFSSVTGDGDITGWQYQVKEEGPNNQFGPWVDIPNSASTTLSHVVSGLTGGTKYQFRVRAVNATGDGLSADSAAVAPRDETLTAGSVETATAVLTIANWTDQEDWWHKHTVPSGGTCAKVSAGTETANLTGLSGNTNYTYAAYSDSGCTVVLAVAGQFLTKPGQPVNLEAQAGEGSGKLTLSSDELGGDGAITKWQYKKKEGSGSFETTWTNIPVTSKTLSHTVENLTDGTDYQFRARAVNATGGGLSADSAAVAPSDITLKADPIGAKTATLRIGNWPTVWHYKQTVPPEGGTCSNKVPENTSTADLTGLSGNTDYTFSAYSDEDCMTELAKVQFLTKPGQPEPPTVAATENAGELTLSSSLPIDKNGSGPLNKWQYSSSADNFLNWIDIPNSASMTLSHTLKDLIDDKEYQFKVRAVNRTGNGEISGASMAVTPLSGILKPESIEVRTAKLAIDKWSGNWWHQYASPEGGSCSAIVLANTEKADLTGLSGNTNYTFSAYNDQFCSSEIATADQFLTKPGMPATPMVKTNVGSGKLTISSSVSGDGTLSKWQYQKKEEGDDDFGPWENITEDSTELSHTVEGLTPGKAYQFRVLALNDTGEGQVSDESTAVAPLDGTLTANPIGATTATLTIGNWSGAWYHKHTAPDGGTCSKKVPKGTLTVKLGEGSNPSLSGNTDYTFSAYEDSLCTNELAAAPQFLTTPGQPTTPTVAATENAGELTLSSSLPEGKNGTGALTKWQYQMKEGNVEFGDDDRWIDITETSMKLNHTVENLDNYRSYQFRVRAVNETGEGLASDGTAATSRADGKLTGADVAVNAWLGQFGRTIAMQTVDVLSQRFATPANTQFTLGGESIPLTSAGKDLVHGWADEMSFSARNNEVRAMSDEDLVFGSSFHLTQEGEEGPEGRWSVWGRASFGRMEDSDGGVAVSGEVATGVLGADWERGNWLAGLALTRSEGEGNLRQHGGRKRVYESESTMTSISPYLRLRLSERLLVWGLAGGGRGDLTMEEKVAAGAPVVYGTDLRMTLAAAGLQSDLFTPDETGGYGLAVKGDAFWVRIKSDAMVSETGAELLSATSADSSRFRLALEGSRPFRLEGGATLTPLVEVGVRHDAGDDETGAGLDVGGGIAYSGPGSRMRVELRAQTLLLHADRNRREWGLSGSFRLLADERGRGLAVSIAHGRGADIGGSDRLWNADAATGLLVGDTPSSDSLETEVGYGLSAFGGRLTQTPYLGFGDSDGNQSMRLGWRLTAPTGLFETSLEAVRRRQASGSSDNGIGLLATARW